RHPRPPAGAAWGGREVLGGVIRGRGGVMRVGVTRMVARVVAEDLRRIVIHRHGSSLLVIMGGRAGSPGSCISSSVCQMTRDFDTQRTGTVALSCNAWLLPCPRRRRRTGPWPPAITSA